MVSTLPRQSSARWQSDRVWAAPYPGGRRLPHIGPGPGREPDRETTPLAWSTLHPDASPPAIGRSTEGFNITDQEGFIICCNEASERIYGYAGGELTGRHVDTLNANPGFSRATIFPAIAETGHWRGAAEQLTRDGTRFLASITVTMMHSPAGSAVGSPAVLPMKSTIL